MAVVVRDLTFSHEVACQNAAKRGTHDGGLSLTQPRQQYPEGFERRAALHSVSLSLEKGSRCLLVGANGAGKSTLLSLIGGRHMIDKDAVRVLNRSAFHDTALAAEVALLTGQWTTTVAFVGTNVPVAAMEVTRLIASATAEVDPARAARLMECLEVDPSWNLSTVSDGQRRRVQIMVKLMRPFSILLLDEVTQELDVITRQNLLTFLTEESQRGATIIYCTHIFDGLEDWATDVVRMEGGRVVAQMGREQMKFEGKLFEIVQQWMLEHAPHFKELIQPVGSNYQAEPTPLVRVNELTYSYPGSSRSQLKKLSFSLPAGSRCLLLGANGSGKTTLLRLMGGKTMVRRDALDLAGLAPFYDRETELNVALLSGDWTRNVACVSEVVPFQADFSVSYLAQQTSEYLEKIGVDPAVIKQRYERLVTLLDININWRLHQVSDGQRRRVQILLRLLCPVKIYLLDEVSTDLDVLARQALLRFLWEESCAGKVVIYATHIFSGMDGWPTHVVQLEAGALCRLVEEIPCPVFNTVHQWLKDARVPKN